MKRGYFKIFFAILIFDEFFITIPLLTAENQQMLKIIVIYSKISL